jgi:ADP-ribose pyrophosphatase YjhB (NUDIX family)
MEKEDVFAYTTDILIFSVSNDGFKDCRSLPNKNFSILLVKRSKEPFKNNFCLPGGYVHINETLDQATNRILEKETNLKKIYKEQLYTFDSIKRDPRRRTISTSYIALIDKNKLTMPLNDHSSWFNIRIVENGDFIFVELDNGSEILKVTAERKLIDPTSNKYDYIISNNGNLAFDHALILIVGLMHLRNKVKDTDIAFNLISEYFTLGELQQIYEIILSKKLIHSVFRQMIAKKVQKTNKQVKTGGHRPSNLYKYVGKVDERNESK